MGDRAHQYIKQALKRGEVSGKFIHTKGVGVSGSFKVNKEEEKKAAKTPVPAKKKPAAAKSEKKTMVNLQTCMVNLKLCMFGKAMKQFD